MLLRNQVEWALHCCGILSLLPDGKYISTRDLAEFHGVPKEYLSKALQALSRDGIIENQLGPTGGYRLAKPASKITFLDIVEAVEGKEHMFKCTEIRKNNPCRNKNDKFKSQCSIARIMHQADEAWRNSLAAVSLADLGVILGKEISADIMAKMHGWLEQKTA